jgi:hypothetical protein
VWASFLANCYYLLYQSLYHLYKTDKVYEKDHTWFGENIGKQLLYLAIVVSLFQGILLAILRVNEPVYQFIVYREIKSWFGILYSNDLKSEKKKNE